MTKKRGLAVNAGESTYSKLLGWRADRRAISPDPKLALEVSRTPPPRTT